MIAAISILVPAYNAERDIEATLTSILQQMEAHHALIAVHDGSRDSTAQVVERLRQAHPAADFTPISQPNQGVATTRNRLLDAATGEYPVRRCRRPGPSRHPCGTRRGHRDAQARRHRVRL